MQLTKEQLNKIQKKIRVVPHGVNRNIFYNQKLPKKDDIFRFISNKGWRGTNWDRGGVQYLIKAFCEEFGKDEKVQLILKLNPSYINPDHIQPALQQLNIDQDHPPISINHENIPFYKLPNLYNQADCYVCATRAEAFNLPGMEAMACGLPTIQTAYGGQVDYMTSDNSLFIDWTLEEVKEDIMYEGISWATPLISSIRKQLRWAFEHQDKIKEKGKQAEEDSKQWSWDSSAKKIISSITN